MGENNFITCEISENYMWNDGRDFWTNSTAKNGREARDFAASARKAAGLGIEQCSEMGCVVSCGGEIGQDMATEAGDRMARTGNIFFATIKRSPRCR